MEISEAVKTNHLHLSRTAAELLEFIRKNPVYFDRGELSEVEVPAFMTGYDYPIQAWPTFVGGATLADLKRATMELPDLGFSIFERIFENDPVRICDYYQLHSPMVTSLYLLGPDTIPSAMVRTDMICNAKGFRCLEINMSSLLGGWHIPYYERALRQTKLLQHFQEEAGIEFVSINPIATLFTHMVEDTLKRGLGKEGRLDIAVITPGLEDEDTRSFFKKLYASVLREMDIGLEGEVEIRLYEDGFHERDGRLFCGDQQVHAILVYNADEPPRVITRLMRNGKVSVYNNAVTDLLGDKRNLALLSQNQDSRIFSARERDLIRNCIPWSRELKPGKTEYEGEVVRLPDFLLSHRERFVIKKGESLGGADVYIGKFLGATYWERRVREAMEMGGWMVQEFEESSAYLYQRGESGCCVQDVIWGMYKFGDRYGGGFLRMMPKDEGDGVINAARGAEEGLIFEVYD